MSPTRRPLQPTASALHFFGAELRHWRGVRGLSQAQVATGVLHSKDLICKIEKADRRPTRDLARRLDDLLAASGALNRLYELVEAEASGARRTRMGDCRVAICGSRAYDTDTAAIDAAVHGLAQLAMSRQLEIRHGPVGVGIEVVTFAADHYQRGGPEGVVAVLGHSNVVRDVDAVVVIGGGPGTRDEIDLATAVGVPLIPFAATGGAARRTYARMERDPSLRPWIGDRDFAVLGSCDDADAIAELTGRLLLRCWGTWRTDRPYTLLRCAMSVDGYVSDATGARRLLSSDEDDDRGDLVRASVDAILVGATAIRRDNPHLLVRSDARRAERIARGEPASPTRVTMSRDGDLDPSADFFATGDATRIVYGPTGVVDRVRQRVGNAAVVVDAGERLSLAAVLSDLCDRGVRRLMIEGGGDTDAQFLARDLVDEVQLTVAPFTAGETLAPQVAGDANYPFSSTTRMSLAGVEHFGDRVRLRYLLAAGAPGAK